MTTKTSTTPSRFEVAHGRTNAAAWEIIHSETAAREEKVTRLKAARLESEKAAGQAVSPVEGDASAAPKAKPAKAAPRKKATAKARKAP